MLFVVEGSVAEKFYISKTSIFADDFSQQNAPSTNSRKALHRQLLGSTWDPFLFEKRDGCAVSLEYNS